MANRGGLEVPLVGFTAGAILLVSALRGTSVVDTLAGVKNGTLDPRGSAIKRGDSAGTSGTATSAGVDSNPSTAAPSGSPKQIIDSIVLPLARQHGINRSAAQNDAGNASHGPTVTGGRSDHQGPPDQRWAADMSNGSSPTPQMDALASALANRFGIKWSGSGAASSTHGGYRYQLIYPSFVGGNHFNHVHFGVARV